MDKINQNCKCPQLKCPNRGHCADCVKAHHKWLHTYCRAGKLERAFRRLHGKLTNWQ